MGDILSDPAQGLANSGLLGLCPWTKLGLPEQSQEVGRWEHHGLVSQEAS